MREQKVGRIVNISSISGLNGGANSGDDMIAGLALPMQRLRAALLH